MCVLYNQPQPFDLSAVFGAGGHNIDPGGINAAVSQDIRQLRNILLNAVKGPCKELPQIVWKDLGGIDPCCPAQPFHLRPNVTAVQRITAPGDEDGAPSDATLLRVI